MVIVIVVRYVQNCRADVTRNVGVIVRNIVDAHLDALELQFLSANQFVYIELELALCSQS